MVELTGQKTKQLRSKIKTQKPFELIFKNDIASAIDYLCRNPDADFGLSELSNKTGISPRNVYRVIDILEEKKLVTQTRTIGSARLFKFNELDPKAMILKGAFDQLANCS